MNKLDVMKMSKHQVIFDALERPIKLDMKKYQRQKPNMFLQAKVSPRKTDKIVYNQKMVNDYVDIINQRLSIDPTDREHDSMKLSQKVHQTSKSVNSHHNQPSLVQPDINIQMCDKMYYSKTNLDCTPKNSNTFHARKSLTKEDKLYLLSDPFQELAKTRQSITDLRAIELEGDQFTQQYKNKINDDYEKEIFKKDMLQRKIFDSQLKYQGNNSIKQYIFQQNMKMSQKMHTEPIEKQIPIIREFTIIESQKEKPKSKLRKTLHPFVMRSFQESEHHNSHTERFQCLYETCENFNKDSIIIKNNINRLRRQTWRKYRKILSIGVSQKTIKID